MPFTPSVPDHQLSPRTGLARRHWLDACQWLLDGAFRHLGDGDAPLRLPEPADAPVEGVPAWRRRSHELETLARTFLIAAPLIAERPDASAGGVRLRDWYARQLAGLADPRSPLHLPPPDALPAAERPLIPPHAVEGCALVLGLEACRAGVWDRLAAGDRARLLDWLHAAAHARTNGHNWRFFNVLIATFLLRAGRAVDQAMVDDHLDNLLAFHAGDGWYRDGARFDFYSAWAFQLYAPLWCRWWGDEHDPARAAQFTRHHRALIEHAWMLCGRDGRVPLWGRSAIYRCAAAAPLAAAFLRAEPGIAPGFARRLCSGALMQFLARDDTFCAGVPTLGFHRRFAPLVQGYSRAGSVYWLGKLPYAALLLPAGSPFWTAREEDGPWPAIADGARTRVLDGPGLALTAHGASGASELRSGRVHDANGDPNYTRLAYSTAFPWEAAGADGHAAMAHSVRDLEPPTADFAGPTALLWAGAVDGVLYRQVRLCGWMARIDGADLPLPGGVLRVDRLRLPQGYDLHLGHYGLPHLDGVAARVQRRTVAGAAAITAAIPGRRLALVALHGWDDVDAAVHHGRSVEAEASTVLYARRARARRNSGLAVVATLLLHRCDDCEWSDDDLSPFTACAPLALAPSGAPGGFRLRWRDGREHAIDFGGIEGRLGC